MIASVAPLRRTPKKLQLLSYFVPAELENKIQVGQLVIIPLRNQGIFGLVVNVDEGNKNNFDLKKIKAIKEIVFDKPALETNQLNFAVETAEFYSTPLGFVLQSNLLPLQKTKIKKIKTENWKSQADKIIATKPELHIYQNKNERTEFFKNLDFNGQTLILSPEISDLNGIKNMLLTVSPPSSRLSRDYGEAKPNIFIFSGDTTDKNFFELWLKIRVGEKLIIIGTRRALFLPWINLRTIILEDEINENHKSYDMAPRLSARDLVLSLAHHHSAKIFLCSHTPSVETFYFAQKGVYSQNGALATIRENCYICDMREERKGRNYSAFSEDAKQAIKSATGDIFIFLNRKGTAAYVGCHDCGFVAKCKQCARGLVFHQQTNTLECHFCKTKINMFALCPKCQGPNVAMYGPGTQQVANDMLRFFSATHDIVRLDSDDLQTEKLKSVKPKIIIGTQIAWDKIAWEKISVMVFLDADSSLFTPEYRIAERLLFLIRSANFKLPPTTPIFLQTSHPDQRVFSYLRQAEKFYEEELSERKMLLYPPFYYILRLYNSEANQELSKKSADELYRLLTLTFREKNLIISNPLPMNPFYRKDGYWYVIIIKIGFEKYKKITKAIGQVIPDNWKFDPNPNNLLSN